MLILGSCLPANNSSVYLDRVQPELSPDCRFQHAIGTAIWVPTLEITQLTSAD